ncbi:hypothetical protein FVEN_g280 [Fusarium venenatum]|nr:hypothetical protein FVEN_g280 [Fusarium venenatum]KAH6994516.1 hypothetical protein EDB82DRAFT_476251 [Fusarium venenatum]
MNVGQELYSGDVSVDHIKNHNAVEQDWFHQLRQPIATLLRQRLQTFTNTVQYVTPMNYWKRHDEDMGSSDGPVVSTYLLNLGNEGGCREDEKFVFVSPPKTHFHYACPFGALYPKRYHECLLQHTLLTMDDVVNHIERYHAEPLYCPRCSQVFDTLIHRDRHIIKRSCELQDLQVPRRINAQQEAALKRVMKMDINDEERWNCIFTTIFPSVKPPSSPYLDQGSRLAIAVVKDYFMVDGRRCLFEFLRTQGLDKTVTGDPCAEAALCQLAFDDLLGDVVERYEEMEDKRATYWRDEGWIRTDIA